MLINLYEVHRKLHNSDSTTDDRQPQTKENISVFLRGRPPPILYFQCQQVVTSCSVPALSFIQCALTFHLFPHGAVPLPHGHTHEEFLPRDDKLKAHHMHRTAASSVDLPLDLADLVASDMAQFLFTG